MKRLMIIDDVKENLSVIDKSLSGFGYDIRLFNNPIIALKSIEDVNPDLILLDINMPQMSGLELCVEIKKNSSSKDIPIIFLTAQDDKESKITGFKNGGVDYITKPFLIEELCARVETHIKISELQNKLRDMNEKLEEKVKERTEELNNELKMRITAEEKLVNAIKEVERADNAKTIFLANMSHELRTPMNGIIGMTELLKMEELTEEQRKLVKYQEEAEEILLKIINDLLDVGKIEKGTIDIHKEKTNLEDILKKVVSYNQYKIENKNILFDLKFDERLTTEFVCDGEKIKVILNQLLSNSIKFTNEGFIKIEVKQIKEMENSVDVEFAIQDTGIGIDEVNTVLFRPFMQGDNSFTKQYQGLGLGLTICQKYIEAMGGEIKYRSQKDVGTTFYFNIILDRETKAIEMQEKNIEIGKSLEVECCKNNKIKKILLAEDNQINMKTAIAMIRRIGSFEIYQAENGIDAVEQYKKYNPDLILMDIQMPYMNGLDAFKEIKKISEANNIEIKVYAATAYAGEEDKNIFLNEGMTGCILKPFSLEKLRQVICGECD